MDYYYKLLEKQSEALRAAGRLMFGKSCAGVPHEFDDHSFLPGEFEEIEEILDEAIGSLSDEEKKEFMEGAREELQSDSQPEDPAGDSSGGWYAKNFAIQKKRKRKWETVIRKWSLKYLREDDTDVEQWARLNRRLQFFDGELMIPSEVSDEHKEYELNRILVFFFLDTSGSCWNLKDRFFNAAASLPEDRFEIRLFCFDTRVEETSLEGKEVYGGGGTSFSIIEGKIQEIVRKEKKSYPETVWIVTDGAGSTVNPEHPDRWKWFLTGDYKSYIPKKSETYNLNDFE
jgi:hypothetical protein